MGRKVPEEINPKRYYIWTWKPKEYVKRKGLIANYAKHYCAVPFYTRYHARRTAEIALGVESLLYIRVISGKSLIAKGITKIPFSNYFRTRVFFKGIPRGMPRYITPPEWKITITRRIHWRRELASKSLRGRKHFNYFYALNLYGYAQPLSKEYLHYQRRKLVYEIFQGLQKTGDI